MSNRFTFKGLIGSISKIIAEEAEGSSKSTKKSASQKAHEEEIQNSILVLAAAVIRCDRNYSSDTENFIHGFLVKHFGGTAQRTRMQAIDSHIDMGTEPFTKIACKELKMLTTHDSRISIVRFLFGVAGADDYINAKETRCINRIAGYLDISEDDFKEIRRAFVSENNPYKLLEVEEEATTEEVRIAYRKMVLKYHPDKREAHISEEEANYKFREIKRAYELIKEQRKKVKLSYFPAANTYFLISLAINWLK